MKTVVVGTAGHIDHGKSSLVKALTGTDPDRWEEERRRGITIDLGFAHRASNSITLDFIDVPGHERFVKNMLAGAGGIDIVLFVIAADDSIKAQTREHFDICRLLGVRSGVVALTKCDLATSDALDLVRLEVEDFVAGSFLAGAPIVPVSANSGQGIDALLSALNAAAKTSIARDASRPFRLPIDRAFSIKGFGTVVTGTLISGVIEKETDVQIYPSGLHGRIRGIEAHGEQVSRAIAGQRTAVNLGGIETSDVARGMTLAAAGRFAPTQRVNASLTMLPGARALKPRAAVHFHCGSAECVAEVTTFGAYAQLRLREPMLLLPGDRFILRQFSPVTTIGGGVVLDNAASRYKKSEDPSAFLRVLESGTHAEILNAILEQGRFGQLASDVLARTGWSDGELQLLLRSVEVVNERPPILADRRRFAALLAAMPAEVERVHTERPLEAGITREELRERTLHGALPQVFDAALERLMLDGKLETTGEVVRRAGREIVMNDAEAEAKREIASAFERTGLSVPSVKEVLAPIAMDEARKQRILKILLQDRTLVRVSADLIFHRSALDWLRELLAQHTPKRINVTQFKELAGITRKYAIPLLEYLDRERVTRRDKDERIIL